MSWKSSLVSFILFIYVLLWVVPLSFHTHDMKSQVKVVNCDQLHEYFTQHKLYYDSQYGFRPKHSTEFAALEIVDRIATKLDQNEIPQNIYLDLSKAFDTLNHNILLCKLNYYGALQTAL